MIKKKKNPRRSDPPILIVFEGTRSVSEQPLTTSSETDNHFTNIRAYEDPIRRSKRFPKR